MGACSHISSICSLHKCTAIFQNTVLYIVWLPAPPSRSLFPERRACLINASFGLSLSFCCNVHLMNYYIWLKFRDVLGYFSSFPYLLILGPIAACINSAQCFLTKSGESAFRWECKHINVVLALHNKASVLPMEQASALLLSCTEVEGLCGYLWTLWME